ncbi:MAG TPA: phosphotransferase, partial [Chitinophagaceae bacterium]|nr:phosphotransferase [Chitinophagaceae bacterium]
VANAIAAIFAATGQDLASIHESAVGILNIERSERGLYCSLNLPSLVIGTLGGGTHLPKQNEALKMMNCDGTGKLDRFAKLIAGFALSLEISTFAAIIGGQFAKAHEKLGRNKPVNWLTRSELNKDFIQKCLAGYSSHYEVVSVQFSERKLIENGIIITVTSRINKKLFGFIPLEIEMKDKSLENKIEKKQILLKIKPLDSEVIKGLHLMSGSIDPQLADLISQNQDALEYKNCHTKELLLYKLLRLNAKTCMPQFYGMKIDEAREIYLFLFEYLDPDNIILINSENEPGSWTSLHIKETIKAINDVHELFSLSSFKDIPGEITYFEPWTAIPLYEKLASIIVKEYEEYSWNSLSKKLFDFIAELENEHKKIKAGHTIIHNDFNPRNVCIRKDEQICIYDWELAVINFPHRDIVEFLSFSLPENFDRDIFVDYIQYHYSIQRIKTPWGEWKDAYLYSLKEYLVTRVSFYMAGRILMDYEFAIHIFLNSFRMIEILETDLV